MSEKHTSVFCANAVAKTWVPFANLVLLQNHLNQTSKQNSTGYSNRESQIPPKVIVIDVELACRMGCQRFPHHLPVDLPQTAKLRQSKLQPNYGCHDQQRYSMQEYRQGVQGYRRISMHQPIHTATRKAHVLRHWLWLQLLSTSSCTHSYIEYWYPSTRGITKYNGRHWIIDERRLIWVKGYPTKNLLIITCHNRFPTKPWRCNWNWSRTSHIPSFILVAASEMLAAIPFRSIPMVSNAIREGDANCFFLRLRSHTGVHFAEKCLWVLLQPMETCR